MTDSVLDTFPNAITATRWLENTEKTLHDSGFFPSKSLAAVGLCRDEITRTLERAIESVWGPSFSLSSLAGLFTAGVTGLTAASHHVPVFEDRRHLVVFALPHIGFDDRIGYVPRPGLAGHTAACGALHALLDRSSPLADIADPEQSMLRDTVLPALREESSLLDATLATAETTETRLAEVLHHLVENETGLEVALVSGIQIHAPGGVDYVDPRLTQLI